MIYGRLAQILGYVHQIRKTGWNAFHKYKYAKESDIVEAVRPILAEYGIFLEQGLAFDAEQGIVGLQRLSKPIRDKEGNVTGTNENLTAVIIRSRFTWWNPVSKLVEVTEWQYWPGYGDDPGDKGVYKALTGAAKYMIMKTFLISTGDDPEGDQNTDKRAAAEGAARQVTVERGGAQGRRPPAAGGKQQETTAPQKKVLKELMKKAGAKNSQDMIAILERVLPGLTIKVDGEDYAGALVAFIDKAPGASLGTAITTLRSEQGEGEPVVSPVRDEAETAQLSADVAAIVAGIVNPDGWESEDKEGTDAAEGPEPEDPADDGALTGDDAAAV